MQFTSLKIHILKTKFWQKITNLGGLMPVLVEYSLCTQKNGFVELVGGDIIISERGTYIRRIW